MYLSEVYGAGGIYAKVVAASIAVPTGIELWTTSPKAFAHVYIDDAAYGCPLLHPPGFHRPCVNWAAIWIV